MIPVLSEAQNEMLVVVVAIVAVFVAIPTAGMYREARAHSPSPYSWTAGMCVASAALPVLGSLLVWFLYTSVEVGR